MKRLVPTFSLSIKFIFVSIFLLPRLLILAQQPEGWQTTKTGGVSFRIGGNQPMDKFLEYSELFNQRNYNFCYALGLGESEIESEGYVEGIQLLQSEGHELFDLTPNFRTNYFITKFDTLDYQDQLGVDHIIGKKVCLEFEDLNEAESVREGYVNIFNNILIGSGF